MTDHYTLVQRCEISIRSTYEPNLRMRYRKVLLKKEKVKAYIIINFQKFQTLNSHGINLTFFKTFY